MSSLDNAVTLDAMEALDAQQQSDSGRAATGARRTSWLDGRKLLAANYGYAPDRILKDSTPSRDKSQDKPKSPLMSQRAREYLDAATAVDQLAHMQRTRQIEVAPNGERTVWMYWESADGAEMPPLVRRCIASAQRHAAITLLDAESIHRFVTPVRGVERLAHVAQKADYFRALLLFTHGGMWLDAATVVCRDLEPLFEALHGSSASLALEYKRRITEMGSATVTECSVQSLIARKRAPGSNSRNSHPHAADARVSTMGAPHRNRTAGTPSAEAEILSIRRGATFGHCIRHIGAHTLQPLHPTRGSARRVGGLTRYNRYIPRVAALGEWVAECERLIQTAGVGTLQTDALGSHALRSALNRTAAIETGEVVGLPLHTVYGPGWREHLLYYAADAAAEREWQREARRCAIAALYGKFMYALPRERHGSLLARLFERSGEPPEASEGVQRWIEDQWGGAPPKPLESPPPRRPGSAKSRGAESPGASPSRYVMDAVAARRIQR